MMEVQKLAVVWGLELIQLFLFVRIVCFQKIKWRKEKVIIVFLSIAIFFAAAIFFWKIKVVILLMGSIFLFLIFLEGKKWHCFLVFWTVYWLVSKLNYISGVLLSFGNQKSCYDYFQNYPENIIRTLGGILIILLIGYAIKHWKAFIETLPDIFYGLSALGGSFFFLFINPAMQFGQQVSNKMLQNIIVMGSVFSELLFYMILLAFFAVNCKCNNYQRENELKEFMLQAAKDYCKEILENEKEIRKFRHDIKHHITTMEYFLHEKKYQELFEYLNDMDKELKKVLCVRKMTGNEILDAILARYIERNPKISFQVEGELSKVSITDYDLCVIFSNAIVNAVEACAKLKEKERVIEIYLKKTGDNIILIIRNPLEWEVAISKLGIMTTKKDRIDHGYGIARIQEVVKKYKGSVDFQIKEEKFQIAVILTENA